MGMPKNESSRLTEKPSSYLEAVDYLSALEVTLAKVDLVSTWADPGRVTHGSGD